jgi:hypothetical protein
MSPKAKVYFECIVGVGALLLVDALSEFDSRNLAQFLTYLTVAILCATCKLRVPGIHATFSPVLVFVLVGIANSSLGEVMAIGCTATLAQCLWRTRSKRSAREGVFSVAAVAIAILVAYNPAHSLLSHELGWATWMLVLSIATFLLVNSGLVCGVVALVAERSFLAVWRDLTRQLLVCYLVSGILAALIIVCDRLWGWKTGLLVVPFLYLTFSVYRLRWDRRGVTAIPIGAYRSTSRPYSRKSVPGPPGL